MMNSRWWAPALLAVAFGVGAVAAPAPAHAQSTLARVLVDVADVVIRGGVPYYRYGNYGQYDRLSVQRDHHGHRSYYRTVYPSGHDRGHGHGNRYSSGYGSAYGDSGGYSGSAYGDPRHAYYGNARNGGGYYDPRSSDRAQREHRRHDRHDCEEHGQCEH